MFITSMVILHLILCPEKHAIIYMFLRNYMHYFRVCLGVVWTLQFMTASKYFCHFLKSILNSELLSDLISLNDPKVDTTGFKKAVVRKSAVSFGRGHAITSPLADLWLPKETYFHFWWVSIHQWGQYLQLLASQCMLAFSA